MAQLIGPDEDVRLAYALVNGLLRSAAGSTGRICTDEAMTSAPAGLLYASDDSAVPVSGGAAVVTVDQYSKWPRLKYPDGIKVLYGSVNGGPVMRLPADDADRIGDVEDRVADLEAGGAVTPHAVSHGDGGSDEVIVAESQVTGLTAALAAHAAAIAASQPADGDLTAIAALSPSNDDFVQRKAGAWTNRTPAQVRTDLGVAAGATPGFLGAWDSGTAYVAGESVVYGDAVYGAVAGSTNVAPVAVSNLISGTPAELTVSDGGDYEMGIRFTVSRKLRLTHLVFYKSSLQANAPHTLKLWDTSVSTTTPIVSTSSSGELTGTTGVVAAPCVADLVAGRTYIVTLTTGLGSDTGYVRTTGVSLPITVGSVTADTFLFSTTIGSVASVTTGTTNFFVWPRVEEPASSSWSLEGRADPVAGGTGTLAAWGDPRIVGAAQSAAVTASLALKAGIITVTAVKTTTYTAGANELVQCDCTAGGFTVTLPAASTAGQVVVIKRTEFGGNTLTVQRAGSDTIGTGAATSTTLVSTEGLWLQSNGAGVWMIASQSQSLTALDSRYVRPTIVDVKGDLIVATGADVVARLAVGADGKALIADASAAAGVAWMPHEPGDVITAGEFVPARRWANQTANALPASGTVAFGYWTADKTEAITTVTTYTGNTAAGATPTLCRVGIYSVAANGDLTLITATTNDTALWAATFSTYAKALAATFNKVAGVRYATGILIVSGAAIPLMVSASYGGSVVQSATSGVAPAIVTNLTGQTDLPSSVAVGSLSANRIAYLCRLT